jgi:serine/threonine protein kinase/tetratricopeptide (TPR) repeat protein
MTIDFDKLREVFHAALERCTPAQRDAYLEQACAGDEELRRQVALLLNAHAKENGPLDREAFDSGWTGAYESPTERPGEVVGPYKLLEQIGEGGFGVVFMAEQTQPVRRRVALKVLKPGMDTRQVVARFEAERQALALMDHPNIAHVFDGGETAGGRPYFVMELVRGVPITDFCDQSHLSVRARLELFSSVCQAVQHAHQKGIIHRDLKPTNVLVTLHDGLPVPKVIDFGIAKATGHQQLTEKTLFTNFAQMIGTPLYMSPEQAEMSGLDIDTRCDIYSLGVLLYELLSGTTPFDSERLRTVGFDEIRRIIREEEPARPSARVSTLGAVAATVAANRGSDPKRLGQLFRGELDWIVMKCLEKDRNRRYETASALAADVQHYLRDEPVQACPPSAWYRFRKLARRNRGTFAAALAASGVVLLAGVGLMVSNVLITREKEHKDAALQAAEANLLLARQAVDEMYTQVANELAVQPLMQPFQRELLRKALRFYQEFARRKSSDPQIRLETAHASLRVAMIDYLLGQPRQVEPSCRAAIAELEGLAGELPVEPRLPFALGEAHQFLARVFADAGRRRQAEQTIRQAIAQYESLAAEHPSVAKYQTKLAVTYDYLGALLHHAPREAEKCHRDAIALCQELVAGSPREPEYQEALANCHLTLGMLLAETGDPQQAEQAIRQAIDLANKARGGPGRSFHPSLGAAAQHKLGRLLAASGQTDKAETAYRQAVTLAETPVMLFPDVPSYRQALASYSATLAQFLEENGQPDESVVFKRSACEQLAKLVAQFPEGIGDSVQSSMSWLGNLALVQRDLGDLRAAEQYYRKALPLAERLASENAAEPSARQELANAHRALAVVLQKAGRLREAADEFRKMLVISEQLATEFPGEPEKQHGRANAQNFLGIALRTQPGKAEAAAQYHRQAIALCERLVADFPDQPRYQTELVRSHYALGIALEIAGRCPEAEQALQRALALLRPEIERGAGDRYRGARASIQNDLAWLRATRPDVESRNLEEALASARKAVALDPHKGGYWNTLGVALYRVEQWQEAVTALNKSMKLRRGGDSFDWFFLAMAHKQLGDHDEAAKWQRRAVEWMDQRKAGDVELRRFRAEAALLLEVQEKKK